MVLEKRNAKRHRKELEKSIPHWYLISRFWRGNISRGFIFAISIGKYEKRALNFAIEAFSTSFYFSKGLNCLKFLDNWNTTKHIFEN